MNNTLYILIAAVIAILLAAFLYLYKVKNKSKTTYFLFFLRALSLFGIFILLLNLKISKRIIAYSKPKLMVLIDNSESIKFEKQDKNIQELVSSIQNNKDLNKKYQLHFFTLGKTLKKMDSLNFNENQTNIYQALTAANNMVDKQQSAILLLTDGNQNIGQSYPYFKSNSKIYPVIFGDTTTYQDVFIDQLNANKYAYLKHKFPVEAYIGYKGNKKEHSIKFSLLEDGKTIYTKQFHIGKEDNSKHISFYIPAKNVGLHHYKAKVSTLKNEKNVINNTYNFSVEVISEQSKILLISDIIHPDIAMFKRAIESNEQRKLILKKPTDLIDFKKYKSVILYQPQANFKTIYNQLESNHKNIFFVTGTHTNWQALNSFQSFFKRDFVSKPENYNAYFNSSFSSFLVDDIGFDNFPPVQDKFGEIKFNVPFESLLFQKINSFKTDQPLMATFLNEKQRFIAFFGENIWRWRLIDAKEKQNFKDFDTFINKSMQFLDAQQKGSLLELNYNKKYFSNEPIIIKAQVFDVNYQFNPNKKLWIKIGKHKTYPFALQNNHYKVELTDLKPGLYHFTVYDQAKKLTRSGSFSVLNYVMEQQNINGNLKDLQQLALNNQGKVFFPNQQDDLVHFFKDNKDYKTIQKSSISKKPLIDWKILLAFIISLLTIEWFLRKYKGLV